MNIMTLWESQVEINSMMLEICKTFAHEMQINRLLIIIIIVWLLILTYKLFKKQQKTL